MPSGLKWSRSMLLRTLRTLIRDPRLTLLLSQLKPDNSATVQWGSHEPTIIKVDAHQSGIITCVLHELIHVALRSVLEPFDNTDLEEPIVEAIEAHLYQSLT